MNSNIMELMEDVTDMVNDVNQMTFDFNECNGVPNVQDSRLTFEYGKEKRGLHVQTCVLYVDVRNSVKLTHEHTIKKMGKVFTAFTKASIMAAYRHGGRVRNIIGDRVMVVFPEENCFKNAVHCAISINHMASKILSRKLEGIDFCCGIGIDYGNMYCIKAGMPKRGTEHEEHQRLIWLGLPANNASRLTDQANKEYKETRYKIKALVRRWFLPGKQYLSRNPYETREMTIPAEEIIEDVLADRIHYATICERDEDKGSFPSILISKDVYDGYKRECPSCNSINEGYWKKLDANIRDITFEVYGSSITWKT